MARRQFYDVKISLRQNKILAKVNNNGLGIFIANEWKRLIDPYTPRRTGNLQRNVIIRPYEIEYLSPYSHYMYEGIVYVDPVFKVGGFTNNGGETWWSRPGVEKVPSNRRFNYLTDLSPFATDHWDRAAEKAGQKEKLTRAVNRILKK